MSKEYVRNHYIPQFILKNFSFNDKNDITYYDLKTKEILITKTNNVFEIDNLYKDKINYPDLPIQIEKNLSKYESEMALLINKKFLNDNEIIITKEEEDSLKLFLAIMVFRSVHVYEEFSKYLMEDSKDFYTNWQPNGDFNDLWKRNLGLLVNCRSIKEVMEHNNIDEPIKIFMHRDTQSYFGMYFIVTEVRSDTHYVIGDCYPTVMTGDTPFNPKLHLYSVYPISPTRMIILASNGVDRTPQEFVLFDKKLLKKPFVDSNKNIHINVKKMYERDVNCTNKDIIESSKYGYIYKQNN